MMSHELGRLLLESPNVLVLTSDNHGCLRPVHTVELGKPESRYDVVLSARRRKPKRGEQVIVLNSSFLLQDPMLRGGKPLKRDYLAGGIR